MVFTLLPYQSANDYWLYFPCQCAILQSKESTFDTLIEWLGTRMQILKLDSITYRYGHIALKRAIENKDTLAMARSYYNLAEWQNYNYDFFIQANDSAIYYDKKVIETYGVLDSIDRVAIHIPTPLLSLQLRSGKASFWQSVFPYIFKKTFRKKKIKEN